MQWRRKQRVIYVIGSANHALLIKQYKDGEEVESGQQAPRRPRPSFYKQPQSQPSNATFNDDEYTKITTPRQDVLFKKGYLGRMRTPVAATTSAESSNDLVNNNYHSEEAFTRKEAQTAEEGMASERCALMNVPEEPYVYTNGYVDHTNMYYMNGDGYELCNFTVLVGPTAAPAPVLAAIPCQPLPLQPLEWFNPPPPPAFLQCLPHMHSSSESQNSGPQSSESPASPEECEEVAPCEEEPNYYQPHPPAYVYPGYMFGPPVFSMNGMTIQGGPPQPLPPSVLSMKHQKKKRRRRRHQGVADDGSEESSSYEKETEKSVNQMDTDSVRDCESYTKLSTESTGSTNSTGSPNMKETEESSLTLNSCLLSPQVNQDFTTNINEEAGVKGNASDRAGESDLICNVKPEFDCESERDSNTINNFVNTELKLPAEADMAVTNEVITSSVENILKLNNEISGSNCDAHKTKTKHISEGTSAAISPTLNENASSKRNKKTNKVASQSSNNTSTPRGSKKGLRHENPKVEGISHANATSCASLSEGNLGNKIDTVCSETTEMKKDSGRKSKLSNARKGNGDHKNSSGIELKKETSNKERKLLGPVPTDVPLDMQPRCDIASEAMSSCKIPHLGTVHLNNDPDAFTEVFSEEVSNRERCPQEQWEHLKEGSRDGISCDDNNKILNQNNLNKEESNTFLSELLPLNFEKSKQKVCVQRHTVVSVEDATNFILKSQNSDGNEDDQDSIHTSDNELKSSAQGQVKNIFVPNTGTDQHTEEPHPTICKTRENLFSPPQKMSISEHLFINTDFSYPNCITNFAQSMSDKIINEAFHEVQQKHFQGLKIMEAVTRWLHTHSGEEILCLPELHSSASISESDGETESVSVDEETSNPSVTGPKNVLCNPLLVSSLNVLILDDASIRVATKYCDEFLLPYIKLLKNQIDTKCDNHNKNGNCSNYNIDGLNQICKLIIDTIRKDHPNLLKRELCKNSIQPLMESEVSNCNKKLVQESILHLRENADESTIDGTQCLADKIPRNDYSFVTDTADYEMEFDNWDGNLLKKQQNPHLDTEFKMETSDNMSCMCDPTLFVGKYYSLGLPSDRSDCHLEDSQTDTESEEELTVPNIAQGNHSLTGASVGSLKMSEIEESGIKSDEAIDVIDAMNKNLDIFEFSYLNFSKVNSGISANECTSQRDVNFIKSPKLNLSRKANVLHHDSTIIMRHLKEKGPFPYGGICCLIQ